ncbi:hypothetical protein CAOG_03613 [Capsaspora owczarzaki ATCC 30864]|uniref:Peptidase M48 domain-containing protein n=1 Tax=Capsaspora owczarzaki (strain ATCC 30864) TaxID=595528 RepID=A0A0D2WPQ5_CAPO3|nr:hypothetical protein CAOG_03613 [Capsaspora owczarzaki ATCC 30864]KJE92698.1 hypothetical protein CAOG_003613 [Capsaspora owczarzaki ATCC 30864]|eukprot:XP_004363341.1 hypothetical protein CAOG_03613 [Capsaspora owczarzaki ATCC 30864]
MVRIIVPAFLRNPVTTFAVGCGIGLYGYVNASAVNLQLNPLYPSEDDATLPTFATEYEVIERVRRIAKLLGYTDQEARSVRVRVHEAIYAESQGSLSSRPGPFVVLPDAMAAAIKRHYKAGSRFVPSDDTNASTSRMASSSSLSSFGSGDASVPREGEGEDGLPKSASTSDHSGKATGEAILSRRPPPQRRVTSQNSILHPVLKDALTFYDDMPIEAVDFVIAHELSHIQHAHGFWAIARANVLAVTFCGLSAFLARRGILARRGRLVRTVASSLLAVIPVTSMHALSSQFVELQADRRAAALGCDFVDGAFARFAASRAFNKFLFDNYTTEFPQDYVPLHLRDTPAAAAEYLSKRKSISWPPPVGIPREWVVLGVTPDGDRASFSHPMFEERETAIRQVAAQLGCDRAL